MNKTTLKWLSILLLGINIVAVTAQLVSHLTGADTSEVSYPMGVIFLAICALLLINIWVKKDILRLIAYSIISVVGMVLLLIILPEVMNDKWDPPLPALMTSFGFCLAGVLLFLSRKKCTFPFAVSILICAIMVVYGGIPNLLAMLSGTPMILAGMLLNIQRTQEVKSDNSTGK